MIAIGAAFRFLELLPDRKWFDFGMEYLHYIFDHHVNLPEKPRHSGLPPHAFWEFIDRQGRPWADEQGRVFSDPGHALEFVGLAYRFLESARAAFPTAVDAKQSESFRAGLCGILAHNFERPFSVDGIGICKSIDLVSGQPINSDMPWWNLPETMRAAAFAAADDPGHRDAHLRILERTSEAFRRHYVRPELNLFAYQTLDAGGRPVDAIPGTPDADPGYHTNLSIMDALRVVEEFSRPPRAQTVSPMSDAQGS
jgi:mannose/cellobiose epimerase-like protein (N-acyl-D-glucosamine 2-epimerase family)